MLLYHRKEAEMRKKMEAEVEADYEYDRQKAKLLNPKNKYFPFSDWLPHSISL